MTRLLLTAPQVATKLGHCLSWFHRHRPRLEGLGFPRPVDGCGNRWDQLAIDRWLDAQGSAPPAPSAEDLLIARAAAMGGQHAAR